MLNLNQTDIDTAARMLQFNEGRLIETTQTLLAAMRDKTHVFSIAPQVACDQMLPSNIARKSAEHASYEFFSTIMDKRVVSEVFYGKFRRLVERRPELIDAKYLYELDKDKLKLFTKNDGSRVLVAPGIGKVLKEDLELGFWKQISGEVYSSARKLHVVYDGDPRKILDGVSDLKVALRKLDVGKGSLPAEKAKDNRVTFRFKGFGKNKTAYVLLMRFLENGFANKLDVHDLLSPFDTHQLNLSIGRQIFVASRETPLHYSVFARNAQVLYSATFKKLNIDPLLAHRVQWTLGSSVCAKLSCYDMQVNGERACPFSEACVTFLDTKKYGKEGLIASTRTEPSLQDPPGYGPY